MGNGIDAGYIDIDCSVGVDASRKIVRKRFEDSTIIGYRLNTIGNTMHNCENSCENICDSYQYKENDSQILTKIKTEADHIMGVRKLCYFQRRQIFSVDYTQENASNLGICDLFEHTSSNVRLKLSKCESKGSELNISNIKAGFTADKDSSVISNSTGYLVEVDEAITEGGVQKLEKCCR